MLTTLITFLRTLIGDGLLIPRLLYSLKVGTSKIPTDTLIKLEEEQDGSKLIKMMLLIKKQEIISKMINLFNRNTDKCKRKFTKD